MRIKELEPNSCSFDEKVEYISLSKPIDRIGILAARINKSQLAKKSSKEPVKQIFHRHIKKEKKYATLKNVQFSEWEPIRESPVPSLLLATPSVILEIAMPNADMAITKKSIERKRYPRVINVLKESVKVTTITKRILDLGVSFIIGKLLASATAVEKQPTKAISKDKDVQFYVNTLVLAEVLKAPTSYSWYSIGLLKVKIHLKDGFKLTTLLDTGAKINVMTKKLMENTNLAIR